MESPIIFTCIFLVFFSAQKIDGFRSFLKKIPNGERVPHPCKSNTIWTGVGHLNDFGGGKRNPFGLAFKNAGYKWTKALCQEDSDKDGKSNGDELGDPGCTWTEGHTPTRVSGISHPGICEPVDSPKCNFQKWISCSGTKSNCSGRTEPGVLSKDIRMPRWNVPAQLTTYFCKTFSLPSDRDYHIVAGDPILDNKKVIHHMIIYGCQGDVTIEKEPSQCMMGRARCPDFLVGWTVGAEGECSPAEAGYRIGKTGYKFVQLQVHWTNDLKETSLYDSSGIKIYYTPNVRKYDMGTMTTGQLHLELPPYQKEIVAQGVCKPYCTRTMLGKSGAVKVYSAALHAHFLGKTLSLAQYRNGTFLRYLAKDDVFSYNNPTSTVFSPSVELRPGDELKTTCKYDTRTKKETTYYGDGTYDEMCFGFIKYYPKIKAQSLCIGYERYSMCDIRVFNNASRDHNFGSCNYTNFISRNYFSRILRSCGWNTKTCSEDCKSYVNEMGSHRCMKGAEGKMLYKTMMGSRANATVKAVWNARAVCSKDVSGIAERTTPFWLSMLLCFVLVAFARN